MGKPYESELEHLSGTYDWAKKYPIKELCRSILNSASTPLVSIGSGGSYTSAQFMADLHRHYTGQVSCALTPLEFYVNSSVSNSQTVWLFSAGGRNVDIQNTFRVAVEAEPLYLNLVCTKKSTLLSEKAAQYNIEGIHSFDLPTGKDGYLATNSLFATCLVIARAYSEVFNGKDCLPDDYTKLLIKSSLHDKGLTELKNKVINLSKKSYTLVLYGPSAKIGAVDLESKFIESAIGNIGIADYRSFAHGRHNWLNRYGERTGIIAFTDPNEKNLANATINLLPALIPIVQIPLQKEFEIAQLVSLIIAMYTVAWVGKRRKIDPGKPHIPEYGRKLYRLKSGFKDLIHSPNLDDVHYQYIQRKIGKTTRNDSIQVKQYQQGLNNFLIKLTSTEIKSVVFDYDGTLVETKDRLQPPNLNICRILNSFLKAGIPVGIATGRGNSVKDSLREIFNESLWEYVYTGYHNCSEIGKLSDENVPKKNLKTSSVLTKLIKLLNCDKIIQANHKIRPHGKHLSIRPVDTHLDAGINLWSYVNDVVNINNLKGLRILKSGHSIDVITTDTNKLSLVQYIVNDSGINEDSILKVGDSGKWPGNDYALLSSGLSLSVSSVSSDSNSCWNITPPAYKNSKGTMYYLERLKINRKKQSMKYIL